MAAGGEFTDEQRALLAPPGLLYGHERRHGSHQTRPRLANAVMRTPEQEQQQQAPDTQAEAALLSPEKAYLFDTMGFLHLKAADGEGLTVAEVSRLSAALDWAGSDAAGSDLPMLRWPAPHGAAFRELLTHSNLSPALTTILGEGVGHSSQATCPCV